MKSRRLFLGWALFMSVIAVGATIKLWTGWAAYVWSDPTHVTLLTISVFLLGTAWCGRLSWKLSGGQAADEILEDMEHAWFSSGLCVSIGLIGTAIGYYLMLKGGIESGSPDAVIRKTFENTSIALINTIVGGICAATLEIQSHFLRHAAVRAQRVAGQPRKSKDAP